MHQLLLTLALCLVLASAATAQDSLAIGQWRSHLPYDAGRYVTQSSEKIYYGTAWSVLSLDKQDLSVEFLSTVDGLSNVGINLIKYIPGQEALLIIYDNSVIDLVRPGGVSTLSQIRNFTNLQISKEINDVFVANDSIVYLAAKFGVSAINVAEEEFVFTTFTGIDMEAITVYRDQIYAATAEGIYRIAADAFTPEDFGRWEYLGPQAGFPGDYTTRRLLTYDDALYLDLNDTLFRWRDNQLQRLRHEPGQRVEYLTAEGEHLLAGFDCVSGGCGADKVFAYSADGSFTQLPEGCLGSIRYAIEDERGRIWFGDAFRGFRKLDGLRDEFCDRLEFNSPWSRNVYEMVVYQGELWMTSGGVDPRFSNRFLDHGFASLIDGKWTIYNRNTNDMLKGRDPDDPGDDPLDFMPVALHPETGRVFAGSYYEGLFELEREDGAIIQYDETNSTLSNAVGDLSRTRVSGLAFDEDNDLWVANYLAQNPLSVLRSDGSWETFNLPCGFTELHQLDVDPNGFVWIVDNSNAAGVLLFDEGEPGNPADDRCRSFTANNSNLPTNRTNCLAVDLNGDVWVGTDEGIVIFECGSSAFEDICQGTLRIFEQDGFNAFLLATEQVQTIAVDGANRKWVGTNNGVFVLSPDGEGQVAHFTEDNSPLFDNEVPEIVVAPDDGEVFIGTAAGLISYRSAATAGGRVHRSNIKVFPNPVRPEFRGNIAIEGLARDAEVKITDINGKLVFETEALGGQAIWDGRDYNGRRVNTGVYLVFSSSNPVNSGFTNPDAAVAKIVFVR